MIRIRKPSVTPAILAGRGKAATALLIRRAGGGATTFKFRSSLYGHSSVRKELLDAQHDKCAFCESKVTHIAAGDVEHFRPKAAVEIGGTLVRPGYYWLAYEWDNLYASCPVCNQRHKRNAFPVVGVRSTPSTPGLSGEQPVFIDPGHEDPEAHIEFIDSAIRGITARGRATIKALGLERDPLDARRRERIRLHGILLTALLTLMMRSDAESQAAKQAIIDELCASMRDEAEYAAMSRCYIRAHPLAPHILAAC